MLKKPTPKPPPQLEYTNEEIEVIDAEDEENSGASEEEEGDEREEEEEEEEVVEMGEVDND